MPRFQIHAYLLSVIAVACGALVWLSPSISSGKRISESFSGIPVRTADWHGVNAEFSNARSVYDQLSTCSLLTRRYFHSSHGETQLDIVLGLQLGDFHQPEVCMGGAGWGLIKQKRIAVHPKGMPSHQAVLNLMKNSQGTELVLLYWFYMIGEVTPTLASRAKLAFQNVFRAPEPAAMVKFTSIVTDSEETSTKAAIDLCRELESSIVKVVRKKPVFEDSDKILKELPAE